MIVRDYASRIDVSWIRILNEAISCRISELLKIEENDKKTSLAVKHLLIVDLLTLTYNGTHSVDILKNKMWRRLKD